MSSTNAPHNLPRKVANLLRRGGVSRRARVLVATSGGADSTALVDALAGLEYFSLQLSAVHVDHGIRTREEAADDLEFLEDLLARLGIKLEVARVAVGEIERTAQAEQRSLEETARSIRYTKFVEAANRSNADWVATAHTQDDQLETILMRMLGGGRVRGMGGIPWRRGRFIRPLIACSRSEVLEYLRERSLSYRIDSTNSSERYLRNRLRKKLLPVVREIFPSAGASVREFAEEIGGREELLEECSSLLIPWVVTDDGYSVRSLDFFRAPPEMRKRSVLRLYNRAGNGRRIPAGFLKPLETSRDKRAGGRLLAGHGAVLEQRAEWVFWRADVVVKTKKSYLIRVFEPSVYHITPTLCLKVSTGPKGIGGHAIGLPKSFVRPPLVVRSRKPGDAIQMRDGRKTLKKLFNEWGVSEELRDLVPIIEDRGGIFAVAGGPLGYRNRIREDVSNTLSSPSEEAEVVFAFEYTGEKS